MLEATLFGVFMIILGGLLFLKLNLVWKIIEEWKSYCADGPSDFYIKTTKFSGIALAIVGLIIIILPFILE